MKTKLMVFVRVRFLSIFLATASMLVSTARGDMLFDNGPMGPPNRATVYNMTETCCMIYDNFVLSADATVTGIKWSGYEEVGSEYYSTWFKIVAGPDPQSGNIVMTGTVVSSRAPNGQTVGSAFVGYDYRITGLNLSLSAGTTYWLGLSNRVSYGSFMASTNVSPLGGGVWQDLWGGFAHHPSVELAFAVEGSKTPPVEYYACNGFESPLSNPLHPVIVKQTSRALPFKANLVDKNGTLVTNSIISAPPVIQVTFTAGMVGTSKDISEATAGAGMETYGNQFVLTDDGKWQFNLKLGKNETFGVPGTYRVTMAPGGTYVISPSCEATFVIK